MSQPESCKHHINVNEACPWCGRKAARGFPIKKPYQFYQGHFTNFVNDLANEGAQGPLALLIVAEDANGEIYMYRRGPDDRQMILAETAATMFAQQFERKEAESCFVNKLKNGIEKLSNLILK